MRIQKREDGPKSAPDWNSDCPTSRQDLGPPGKVAGENSVLKSRAAAAGDDGPQGPAEQGDADEMPSRSMDSKRGPMRVKLGSPAGQGSESGNPSNVPVLSEKREWRVGITVTYGEGTLRRPAAQWTPKRRYCRGRDARGGIYREVLQKTT